LNRLQTYGKEYICHIHFFLDADGDGIVDNRKDGQAMATILVLTSSTIVQINQTAGAKAGLSSWEVRHEAPLWSLTSADAPPEGSATLSVVAYQSPLGVPQLYDKPKLLLIPGVQNIALEGVDQAAKECAIAHHKKDLATFLTELKAKRPWAFQASKLEAIGVTSAAYSSAAMQGGVEKETGGVTRPCSRALRGCMPAGGSPGCRIS